ncbi:MAG: hypothetical protein ABXS91_10755 [Sulfurimonas sp.]
MALSNWDVMAIDEEGYPTNGVFRSPSGVIVEIYKNWLNIHEEDSDDTTFSIHEGDLRYKDVNILAAKESEDSCFIVVWSGYKHDNTFEAMYGIGAYAFEGSRCVGITEKHIDEFKKWIRNETDFGSEEVPSFDNALRFNQGDAYFVKAFSGDISDVATRPGEAKKTIIEDMFSKDNNKGGES